MEGDGTMSTTMTQTQPPTQRGGDSASDFYGALGREDGLLAAADLDHMKRTFVTGISHALRTPLTSILGYTVTLAKRGEDISAEERSEMLERLERNARRLDGLLQDLLDIDRLTRGGIILRRRRTDLAQTLLRSARRAELGARKVDLDVEPVIAEIDAELVERLVVHLLLNADQQTPSSGRVWARLRRVQDGVVITVDDEGPGIPDETKRVIFEPLRSGGELSPAPGLGVGLALVAGYAELHGGRAWVGDRPGGGASFRVFLPSEH